MGRVSAPGIGRQTNKNTNRLAARLHAVNVVKFEKLAFEFQAQLASYKCSYNVYIPAISMEEEELYEQGVFSYLCTSSRLQLAFSLLIKF